MPISGSYVDLNRSGAPAGAEGRVYYDSTNKKLYYHDGTGWKEFADVRTLEDDYIELFKAGDPKGLKVWVYASDLVYLGKLTWDDVAKFANDVKDVKRLAFEFNGNVYFSDDEIASILNSANLAVDKVASILNNANITADRVASIADSTNITSSRIKELLDTGVFTDADKIAALLDGVITADDAATHVNSGIYSDDLLASAFNSTYLAVDKAASILNNANITVQRASSIISNGNLSGTKLIDILISSNLNKDRAASILEGSTRFVRYSFESGENWTLGETNSNMPARITTETGYVTHGSQAFTNDSSGPVDNCHYALAYIRTNVANVVGVFYDVVPCLLPDRQRSEIWINNTIVFTSTNHVRNLRFKLSSPTTVTKLEVRSHKIGGTEPGTIYIDNIRLVI